MKRDNSNWHTAEWLASLANWLFGLVEVGLGFRFVLKLLGANARSEVVQWVYDTTAPLLKPFLFAFPTPSIQGKFSLEFTTLFAIFTYAFIGYVVQEGIELLSKHKA